MDVYIYFGILKVKLIKNHFKSIYWMSTVCQSYSCALGIVNKLWTMTAIPHCFLRYQKQMQAIYYPTIRWIFTSDMGKAVWNTDQEKSTARYVCNFKIVSGFLKVKLNRWNTFKNISQISKISFQCKIVINTINEIFYILLHTKTFQFLYPHFKGLLVTWNWWPLHWKCGTMGLQRKELFT